MRHAAARPAGEPGPESPAPLALGALLDRVAGELGRMGRTGHALQEGLSPALARLLAHEPSLLVALQGLDGLTQRIEALAAVVARLAEGAAPGWAAPAGALVGLPLADLHLALAGPGAEVAAAFDADLHGPLEGDLHGAHDWSEA